MDETTYPEEELVNRCKRGDREAFNSLVDAYRKVLFVTAFLMTGDRLLAEDAVQEALIKMWTGMSSLKQGSSIKPWLKVSASGILVAFIALYFSVFFQAGKPGDFLARVSAATAALSSYRVVYSIDPKPDVGIGIAYQYDVTYSAPSYYDIFRSFDNGLTSEVVLDGQNTYVHAPETGWVYGISDMQSFPTQLQFSLALSKEQTLELVNSLVRLTRLGDEKINGVECFHYRGDVDMLQWFNKWKAWVIAQNPEVADEQFDWDIWQKGISQVAEQMDLWVGKSDYLIQQTDTTLNYTDPGIPEAHLTYRYYYPAAPVLASPVDAAGKTLPGWFLYTDAVFKKTAQASYQTNGQVRHAEVQIGILNTSGQECRDVRVYFAASTTVFSEAHLHAAQADSADLDLSPGEQQTFRAAWDLNDSAGSGSGISFSQVFVEYTTGDGIDRVSVPGY